MRLFNRLLAALISIALIAVGVLVVVEVIAAPGGSGAKVGPDE